MKKTFLGLIFGIILFSLIGYSNFADKIRTSFSDNIKYSGINMQEIKEDKVLNNLGEEIGKRGIVKYNPDKITEESLSNFYKDKIKNSGYDYYTLINEKDKTKGIVSVACINVLTYAEIDNNGYITRATKNFEVK